MKNSSIKLKKLGGQHRMAAYLADQRGKRGLTKAEAAELVARLLKKQYVEAKI